MLVAPERLGDSSLERLALQALGEHPTIGSDQELRVGTTYRLVELERFRSAVAEYGLRPVAVAEY